MLRLVVDVLCTMQLLQEWHGKKEGAQDQLLTHTRSPICALHAVHSMAPSAMVSM
jgi:hypothetical protein